MKHVIAIDIGGTKTIGAVISEDGSILEELRVPTNPSLGPDNLIESLKSIISSLIAKHAIDCIAIGSAGRINTLEGSVFYSSNNLPGWTHTKIKEIIESEFNILTVVENDCKVAGLGEEWRGSAQGLSSYVCLVLGTGVGASVKIEDQLVHGAHWSAGELGHMTLYPNGRQCNCGLKGCLEQYCSGPSLVKRFNERSEERIETGYDFFEAYQENNEVATQILDEFVDNLATAVISLFNIYDPEKIIIGGGLADTKEYWWDRLEEKVAMSPLNDLFKPIIVPAKLGNRAGIFGSAYLGFQTLKHQKLIRD